MSARSPVARVGLGYDSHRFKKGRPLILGGVTVPHDRGLDGHSDADVVLHAVIDAVLGAAGLGAGVCAKESEVVASSIGMSLFMWVMWVCLKVRL